MRTILNRNLAAAEPLTPLNIGEAVHYIGCNLTNRLVHPDSICDRCQQSQMVLDDGADAEPTRVGKGVRGEITVAVVEAAEAKTAEDKAIEAMRVKAVEAKTIETATSSDVIGGRA